MKIQERVGVVIAGLFAVSAQGCHRAAPPPPPQAGPECCAQQPTLEPDPPRQQSPGPLTSAERDSMLSEAQARRAAWRMRRITDYRIRVAVDCFCPWPKQPRVLDVRDGKAIALLDTTGRPAGPLREPWEPYTVEGMFDFVEQSLRSSDMVSVRYDSSLGYPTQIRGDRRLARFDDWFGVTATDLTSRR
jgi:uncharacterized protein DUF6174